MDIVYPYRESLDGLVFRFSLRSLQNLPHDRVFVIGDRPKWIQNVEYVRYPDAHKRASANSWFKLLKACMTDVSQRFIFMDDDHLIMKPRKDIPYFSRGLIKDIKPNKTDFYRDLKRTGELFDIAICYNKVHAPIVYDKHKVLKLIKRYPIVKSRCLHKSLYGNYYKCAHQIMGDCKARTWDQFETKLRMGDSIISTSPKVEADPRFKEALLRYFPKRSKHEKTNI